MTTNPKTLPRGARIFWWLFSLAAFAYLIGSFVSILLHP